MRVEIERSIADGQLLPEPGVTTFAVVSALVDDIVTVADDEIVETMRFAFERMKVVVEPSGASALAALMAGRVALDGARAGVVLSGGNVDAERFASLVVPARLTRGEHVAEHARAPGRTRAPAPPRTRPRHRRRPGRAGRARTGAAA